MVFDAEFDAYQRGPDRASPAWRVTAGLAIAAGLAVVVVVWWAMASGRGLEFADAGRRFGRPAAGNGVRWGRGGKD